ncbi:MAG: tandem-95 repeat protein, partial [Chlorobiales bacterium]|nr:tandem-95 repeat protein [Chlorobiales bacterium]
VLRDTMTVDVVVKQTNRKPTLAPIAAKQVKENMPLTFTISATDPDKEDLGKLVFSAPTLPVGATFNAETKTFTWTPTFDQSGPHTVVFKVTDSAIDGIALSDTASVAITVININRAPMLAKPAEMNGTEDTPLTFAAQVSDLDKEDTGKLKVVAKGLPEGATFDGTNLSWKPSYTQAGSYKIKYVVTDVESLSDSAVQVITISDKNRAPKFKSVNAQRGTENTSIMFPISATDLDEQDAGKLKYSAVNLPEGASFDGTTQIFSWNPSFIQAGSYQIQFKVSDIGMDGHVLSDSMSVPVTIANVNRRPEIAPVQDTTVSEGANVLVNLRVSDQDKEDAGKLVTSASSLPKGASLNGTQLSWKPDFDQAGSYSITYTVKDQEGLNVSTTQKITVLNTNRQPVLTVPASVKGVETEEIKFKVQASDPDKEDADKIRVTTSELPQGAKYEGGEFSWKPTFEQAGSYTVTYKVEDAGGLSDTKTLTITVTNKNRAPKLSIDSSPSIKVNATETVSFSASASDEDSEDAGKLTFSADKMPQGASMDSKSGKFTWTPTSEQTGTEKITIKVSDNSGAVDSQTVTIVVSKLVVSGSETAK